MKKLNPAFRCPDCGRTVTDKDAVYCDHDGARLVRIAPASRTRLTLFVVNLTGLALIVSYAYLIATESPLININATAAVKAAETTQLSGSESNKQLAAHLLRTCFGTEPKLPPTVGEDQSDILKLGKNLARQSTDVFADLAGGPKLSDNDRKSAGNVLAKSIHEQYGRPKASPSGPRIEKIAARLQESTKRENDLCCSFQVLPSKDFNAYMGPGGRGYVLEGLISRAQSDDQLAFVLGHEIAHSLLEHPERSLRVSLAAQRAGKDLTGSDSAGETTEFIAAVTTGLLSKTYSQDQEYEADRLGLCIAYLAGYQPSAGSEFMNIMGQIARDHSVPTGGARRVAYDLLSSHPPSGDRKRYQDSLAKFLSKQNSTNKK
jgi:hypothetical protein